MRRGLAWLTAAIVLIPLMITASPIEWDPVWGDRQEEKDCEIDAAFEEISFPECEPPPLPTTTTTAPPTTTTLPPTTTTLPPTTTTTAPSGLEIPPTISYPTSGFKTGEGFKIMTACIESPAIPCQVNSQGGFGWFDFNYWGHGLPYLFNENGSDGAWWLAGDRGGYAYAYGFLQTGEHIHATDSFINEEIIARFTVITPETETTWGKVNDTYMDEGVRYYDGTYDEGDEGGQELGECKPKTNCLDPVDYSTVCDLPAWAGRVGLFTHDGQVVDIRDFGSAEHRHSGVVLQAEGKFVLISFDGSRASIGWCPEGQDGLGIHIYYDAMGRGQISVD